MDGFQDVGLGLVQKEDNAVLWLLVFGKRNEEEMDAGVFLQVSSFMFSVCSPSVQTGS